MMRTLNFKVVGSPDERLNSSLSAYRSMVQYALNYAISKNIKSLSKLHRSTYRGLRAAFNSPSRLTIDAMRQALWIYGRWRKSEAKKPISEKA